MTGSDRTTFILIRHGETEWNIQNRVQGHGDSPLTPKGREQTGALGRRLQNISIDAMVASDLGRTRETAAIISRFTGHAVRFDARLRERNYGLFEGLTISEIADRYPDAWKRFLTHDPDFIIPEGESHRQCYSRHIAFVEEMVAEKAGKTMALVVHGGVLDSLFRHVVGLRLECQRCFTMINSSIGVIRQGPFYGTQRWVIDTWGDVAHLDGGGQDLGLG